MKKLDLRKIAAATPLAIAGLVGSLAIGGALFDVATSATERAVPLQTGYQNPTLGFAIDLPDGWRRSDRLSGMGSGKDLFFVGQDVFTMRSTADEASVIPLSEFMGPAYAFALVVEVYRNPQGLTALQWAQSPMAGERLGQRLEAATVAGTPAVRIVNGARYTVSLYVAHRDKMFQIAYLLAPDPSWKPKSATEQHLRSMINSFRFTQ